MKVERIEFLNRFDKEVLNLDVFDADDIGVVPYFTSCGVTFTPMHTHDFWEIIVMCDKSMLNILDGEKTVLSGYDICLVKPHNIHMVTGIPGINPQFYNLEISAAFFKGLIDSLDDTLYDELLRAPNIYYHSGRLFHDEILSVLKKSYTIPNSQVREKQSLLKLLVARITLELLIVGREQPRHDNLIASVLELMSDPEKMDMPLKELVKSVGYCLEHVIRVFKKKNLGTPAKKRMEIKLVYACNLLESTDLKIITIAGMIGFGNVNYFNRIFKEKYGITPGAYRKSRAQRKI